MIRLFTYGGIAVAIYIMNHGSLSKYGHGPIDFMIFLAFLCIVVAFHWPQRQSGTSRRIVNSAHHEGTGQGFLFRCGKAFKKVLRYRPF